MPAIAVGIGIGFVSTMGGASGPAPITISQTASALLAGRAQSPILVSQTADATIVGRAAVPAENIWEVISTGVVRAWRADLGTNIAGVTLATGTTPPAVTLSGDGTISAGVRIEITTGGPRGTALFRYAANNGAASPTWIESGVTTAATYNCIGALAGLVIEFPTGTDYTNNNVYQGTVGAWTDQITGTVLLEAATTLRPRLILDPDWSDRAALHFDGSNDALDVSDANTDYTFLSDGSGCTVLTVFRGTGTGAQGIWSTRGSAVSSRGAYHRLLGGSDAIDFGISDGTSNVILATSAGTFPEGSSYATLCTHATAETPDASLYMPPDTSIASGSGTPSASAPAVRLFVGSMATGTALQYTGTILELVMWNRVLTSGERDTVTAYVLARYGI